MFSIFICKNLLQFTMVFGSNLCKFTGRLPTNFRRSETMLIKIFICVNNAEKCPLKIKTKQLNQFCLNFRIHCTSPWDSFYFICLFFVISGFRMSKFKRIFAEMKTIYLLNRISRQDSYNINDWNSLVTLNYSHIQNKPEGKYKLWIPSQKLFSKFVKFTFAFRSSQYEVNHKCIWYS